MKKLQIIKAAFLSTALIACIAIADTGTPTIINSVNITYSQAFYPEAQGGVFVPQAIIGGTVSFTGQAPVYVTVQTGGQNYTQPTDSLGNFSFFVYTNGDSQFNVQAWTPSSSQSNPAVSISKTFGMNTPASR